MKRLLFVVMITMFIPLLGCCGSRQQQEKVVYKPGIRAARNSTQPMLSAHTALCSTIPVTANNVQRFLTGRHEQHCSGRLSVLLTGGTNPKPQLVPNKAKIRQPTPFGL